MGIAVSQIEICIDWSVYLLKALYITGTLSCSVYKL